MFCKDQAEPAANVISRWESKFELCSECHRKHDFCHNLKWVWHIAFKWCHGEWQAETPCKVTIFVTMTNLSCSKIWISCWLCYTMTAKQVDAATDVFLVWLLWSIATWSPFSAFCWVYYWKQLFDEHLCPITVWT